LLRVQANRSNARASSGPKTLAGKARSARDARRHGLSVPVWAIPELSAEAETLALELGGPTRIVNSQRVPARRSAHYRDENFAIRAFDEARLERL
jgi:hypothetical protein